MDREIPPVYFSFGVLRHFDLPQLMARSQAKGIVANPIDGDLSPLNDDQARALLPGSIHLVTGRNQDDQILAILKPWL